jgi:hypothetical protein
MHAHTQEWGNGKDLPVIMHIFEFLYKDKHTHIFKEKANMIKQFEPVWGCHRISNIYSPLQ